MSLVVCEECGKEISDQAKACIHCGKPMVEEHEEVGTPCAACKAEGNYVLLGPPVVTKEVPTGAKFVAVILIIIGVFFILNIGIFFILGGILIFALGKKEERVMRCPRCNGKRHV